MPNSSQCPSHTIMHLQLHCAKTNCHCIVSHVNIARLLMRTPLVRSLSLHLTPAVTERTSPSPESAPDHSAAILASADLSSLWLSLACCSFFSSSKLDNLSYAPLSSFRIKLSPRWVEGLWLLCFDPLSWVASLTWQISLIFTMTWLVGEKDLA